MSAYLWFIHVQTRALRAKGIFAVAIPGHDRKSVSQPAKKKRNKGKTNCAVHLLSTSLRDISEGVSVHRLTHTHTQIAILLTAGGAMLNIGSGTAVCIMQDHFSVRTALRSRHQPHFALKPRQHKHYLPSLAHIPVCTLIKRCTHNRRPLSTETFSVPREITTWVSNFRW